MWGQLIKVASLSKSALVVGVAASAAMVSNAEFSNTPSHNEVPSATPIVSTAPSATPKRETTVTDPKATDKPTTRDPNTVQPSTGPKHGEVPGVIKECVEKYLALRELGDHATTGERQSTGEVCKAALAQSGLSPADFWARFGPETHTSAPKTETPNTAALEALIKECVAQRLAGTADQSDACHRAIAASGLTPQDFWTKFGPRTDTAKHELSPEVQALIRECVTKYTAHATDATATCRKAIELTGLTSAEFAAKFFPRTTETKPTATLKRETTTKPVTNTAEVSQLIAKCLQMYAAVNTGSDTRAVSEACGAAIKASGLTSTAFWAKYHPATN